MKGIGKCYIALMLALLSVFSCVGGVFPSTFSQEDNDTEGSSVYDVPFDPSYITDRAESVVSGASSDGSWKVTGYFNKCSGSEEAPIPLTNISVAPAELTDSVMEKVTEELNYRNEYVDGYAAIDITVAGGENDPRLSAYFDVELPKGVVYASNWGSVRTYWVDSTGEIMGACVGAEMSGTNVTNAWSMLDQVSYNETLKLIIISVGSVLAPAEGEGGQSGGLIGGGGTVGGGSGSGIGSENGVYNAITFDVLLIPYSQASKRTDPYGAVIDCITSNTNNNGGVGYTHYGKVDYSANGYTGVLKGPGLKSGNSFVKTVFEGTIFNPYLTFVLNSKNGDVHWVEFANGGSTAYFFGSEEGAYNSAYDAWSILKGSRRKASEECVRKFISKCIAGDTKFSDGKILGEWDVDSVVNSSGVATDSTVYAKVLKYFEVPDEYIKNYIAARNCTLDPSNSADAQKLIPVIIWESVIANFRSGSTANGTATLFAPRYSPSVYRCDTKKSATLYPGMDDYYNHAWPKFDSAKLEDFNGSSNWCKTDSSSHSSSCTSYAYTGGSYGLRAMHGIVGDKNFNSTGYKYGSWKEDYLRGKYVFYGAGAVNKIPANGVDSSGSYYFYRNYWSPYGKTTLPSQGRIKVVKYINGHDHAYWTNVWDNQGKDTKEIDDLFKGWKFNVYNSKGEFVVTLTTDESGTAVSEFLDTGDYTVKETSVRDGFKSDTTLVPVKVSPGQTTPAKQSGTNYTANNQYGRIAVKKYIDGKSTSVADERYANWKYQIATDEAFTNIVYTVYTDKYGKARSGKLPVGMTYYVREAPAGQQNKRDDAANWVIDSTPFPVTVSKNAADGDVLADPDGNGYTSNNLSGKYVRILKVSSASTAVMNQLKGNKMYSLEGAQFRIWVNGQYSETITTKKAADGNYYATSTKLYKVGDVISYQEIVAPPGYKLDSATKTVKITNTGSTYYEISVANDPAFDPGEIILHKVDKNTENGRPQGDLSFEGAIFKWEYYDNTNCAGTPKRTWYFAADADGYVSFEKEHIANGYSSSSFYTLDSGKIFIPVGSIRVTEVKSPPCYNKIATLKATVTIDYTTDSETAFRWTETGTGTIEKEASTTDDEIWAIYEPLSDNPILGSITVQKIDPVYGTNPFGMSFAGCQFDVINESENEVIIGSKHFKPGDVVCTITTDKKGHATTGKILPVGTYKVVETKGNPYYDVNKDFKATFRIEVESPDPNVTLGVYNEKEVRVKNPVHPGRVVIRKSDPQRQRLEGAKFALEWSKDGVNWTRVHKSNSNKYLMRYGGCSSANLDSDGCLTTGSSGIIAFEGLWPTLYYRVVEVEAPDGYTLLSEPVVIDELAPDRCS